MLGYCFILDKAPAPKFVSPAATLDSGGAWRVQSKHKDI